MQPSITTLEKEIAREERIVGIRPGQRLTPARISRRQFQVASVVVLVTVALLGIAFSPRGTTLLRGLTVALAFSVASSSERPK